MTPAIDALMRAVAGAALVLAAIVVLGQPDVAAAARFFTQDSPTMQSAEALLRSAVWIVIAAVIVGLIWGLVRTLRGIVQHDVPRSRLMLAAAALILVASLVHRVLPRDSFCCGSNAQQVHQVVYLAR